MSDLWAVLIGVACGVLAGVPTSILVLVALYRRDVTRAQRPRAQLEREPREVLYIFADQGSTQLTVPEPGRSVGVYRG